MGPTWYEDPSGSPVFGPPPERCEFSELWPNQCGHCREIPPQEFEARAKVALFD